MVSDKNIFGKSAHLETGQLLNYIRRSLSKAEEHEVERHLADCELCSDALEGLRKLDADTNMLVIASELHKMARRRNVVRKKIFSQLELVTVFAVTFLLIFLIVIAFIFFIKK